MQCLLDTALDPVVEAAVRGKAGAEAERAILDLKVCDPAAGSGHFLVGAAHRLARHLARVRAHSAGDGEPSPLLHQQALRDVIGHCLYGVDRNPMAAELCRVSLWLEALEPGKPLSFLDHHIRVGNSLLGATPELIEAGLPDEAFNPIQGDDRKVCSGLRRKNRGEREDVQHVMDLMVAEPPGPEYGSIASLSRDIDESPDDTLDEVRRKAARFQRLIVSPRYRRKQRVADAWCAAFVQPKRAGDDPALCITTRTVRRLQADPGPGIDPGAGTGTGTDVDTGTGIGPDANPDPGVRTGPDADPGTGARTGLDAGSDTGAAPDFDLDAGTEAGTSPGADALSPVQRREVERLTRRYRFFHWDLAFPEVFDSGGFDCVLGNPPWERVKLQEKEWFAERKPEIADAPTAAARKRMIETLKTDDFPLYRRFLDDLRESEGWSHLMRNTGRYPLCGRGDINLYAVFAECMRNVVNEHGRTGCVLPTGIATDDTTKFFFQDVVETRALASVFDFENRSRLFPDVDSRMKFCLFTAGSGRRTAIGPTAHHRRQTVIGQRPDIEPTARHRWRRIRVLRSHGGRAAQPRTPLHALSRRHRAPEPQHPHLPDLPLPQGRRADQGHLSPGAGADPGAAGRTTRGESVGYPFQYDVPHVQRLATVPHARAARSRRLGIGRQRVSPGRCGVPAAVRSEDDPSLQSSLGDVAGRRGWRAVTR